MPTKLPWEAVVPLVQRGMSAREMARELKISLPTVYAYMTYARQAGALPPRAVRRLGGKPAKPAPAAVPAVALERAGSAIAAAAAVRRCTTTELIGRLVDLLDGDPVLLANVLDDGVAAP